MDVLNTIVSTSQAVGIDPSLALAIAQQESNLNPLVVRFEPRWTYFVIPKFYAQKIGITLETELTLQAMSWGCFQVMGSVCRELNYTDNLTQLILDPGLAILLGCRKILELTRRYPKERDAISAYNAGSIKLSDTGYLNQKYVDDVTLRLTKLRGTHA